MSKKSENDLAFSANETAQRRDEVIRRMANTPPQPKATTPHRPKKKTKAGMASKKKRSPDAGSGA
jgi:hypothetical protein